MQLFLLWMPTVLQTATARVGPSSVTCGDASRARSMATLHPTYVPRSEDGAQSLQPANWSRRRSVEAGPLGSAQPLVAMKYVLTMSPSTCAVSIEVKPASVSISWAFCSPHIVPRPIPPSARETVMQCMQEMV
jgi:hypothetical protein